MKRITTKSKVINGKVIWSVVMPAQEIEMTSDEARSFAEALNAVLILSPNNQALRKEFPTLEPFIG